MRTARPFMAIALVVVAAAILDAQSLFDDGPVEFTVTKQAAKTGRIGTLRP